MGKLRVFLDWIEDIAYGLYISFYTPRHVKEAIKEGEEKW
jgi:hypothetical protein